eukprot:gene192-202_t
MIPVAIPINQSYVFESDNESHVNADELSDLSDVFDDNESVNGLSNNEVTTADSGGGGGRSLISLDEIPYDRDVKWINVPTNARPRHSLINPDALRMLKNVDIIASGKANDRVEERKKSSAEPRGRRRELREGGETNAGARQAEYNRSRHADANATERAHNHSYTHHKQSPRDDPPEAGGGHPRRAHGRRSSKEHTPFTKATPSPGEFSGKSSRRQQSYQQPSSQPMQMSTSLNASSNQMTTSSDENAGFQLNPCAREFVPSFSFR